MAVSASAREFEWLYKKQPQRKATRQRINRFPRRLDSIANLQLQFAWELERRTTAQTLLQDNQRRAQYGCFPPLVKHTEKQKSRPRFKKILNRVSSASGTPICPETTCNRQDVLNDSQLCRHFCELLGPNLCSDCIKRRERYAAIMDCEETPSLDRLDRDPFSAFITTHYSKHDYDFDDDIDEEMRFVNEISDNWQEHTVEGLEEGTVTGRSSSPCAVTKPTPSPSPPREDSGYSSRVSYIRDLTRAQSCGFFRSLPLTPTSPPRREKTQGSAMRAHRINKSGSGSRQTSGNLSLSSPNSPFSIDSALASTLERLEERRRGLDGLSGPTAVKPAWSTKIEPILMELRLINFTQYDELGYGPSQISESGQNHAS